MVYIFVYLFLEVMVSTYLASFFGGIFTFFEIIITAFVGAYLLKNFKYSLMANVKNFAKGKMSQGEFMTNNVANALGAVLLIIPGYLTDIFGILLQFSLFTALFTKLFAFTILSKNTTNYKGASNNDGEHFEHFGYTHTTKRRYNDEEIIDVEIIDDSKSIKH